MNQNDINMLYAVTNGENTPATSAALDLRTVQLRAYECFKLWWMIQHGHSVQDLLGLYSDFWGDVEADSEGEQDFADYIMETGFSGGEIWPCFNEFLGCEFQDVSLMFQLLPSEEYSAYLHYVNAGKVMGGSYG